MPNLDGRLSLSLTVRDPARSAEWYSKVLGFEVDREYAWPGGRDLCLRHEATDLQISLLSHSDNTGESFSESQTGLDHLEFLVAARSDLDQWVSHLDSLGIAHSGVKEPSYTRNAMITFRDPDNIQLEFFWRAPPAP